VKQPHEGGVDLPMFLSAAMRRWLASGGSQGHPTSQGGPWRRKRMQRRLGVLIEEAKREPSPIAAATHVRVIEVPDSPDAIEGQVPVKAKDRIAEHESVVAPAPPVVGNRPAGFHVRAVPINQLFSDV
jgi:hypothetical protein